MAASWRPAASGSSRRSATPPAPHFASGGAGGPPHAVGDGSAETFTTNQYTALNITQEQLLAGDTGGVSLQASNPTQPAHAALADNHNGTFTFTPDPGFTGSTTFQYAVGGAGQTELTAADGASSDYFGFSVSVSGDTAVLGAENKTVNGHYQQGAAYVFTRVSGSWTQQAALTAVDGAAGDLFGSSVSVSCDTAVIGAPSKTVSGYYRQGTAYVFTRVGGSWTQQAELTAADGASADGFGGSVSVSGDTTVIGAYSKAVNGQDRQGAAYVFTRVGGSWTQQAELAAADGAAGDSFGYSVSVNGDTAVIGAFGKTINGHDDQGTAYVFTRVGGSWIQQAELIAADGATFDHFGNSVSVSGDTTVIGANSKSVNGHGYQGVAYVFTRVGGSWTQQVELIAADGASSDAFGSSVSVSGDTAVIGAFNKTVNGHGVQGTAYVFTRVGGSWTQQAELAAVDGGVGDNFGSSVSVSGDTAVIGAEGKTVNGHDRQGAAYVQDLTVPATATATVAVTPATAQLVVSPASLPDSMAGVAYASPTFTAAGGVGGGYTFQESGILPAGLSFDPATGQLTGIPTRGGSFPGIIIAAGDGHGGSGSRTYTLSLDYRAGIRGLYHTLLNRAPEADAAVQYWETVFEQGSKNPQLDPFQYVAQGIWESEEHRYRQVESYYHTYLGRSLNPDNVNERQYWVNQFLIVRAKEADVIRGIVTSAEYLYLHRAEASLAQRLNTDLLAGNATTAQLQDWNSRLAALDAARATATGSVVTPAAYKDGLAAQLAALNDETAKTGVLFDVLNADDYTQPALDRFYLAFVRRPGTAAEKQALLSQRDAAGHVLDTIAELMLSSPEYRSNAVNSQT